MSPTVGLVLAAGCALGLVMSSGGAARAAGAFGLVSRTFRMSRPTKKAADRSRSAIQQQSTQRTSCSGGAANSSNDCGDLETDDDLSASPAASAFSAGDPQRRRRETLEDEMKASGGTLTVKPIGVVRSVYRLCVGTPRQGLLAPHARGRIEFTSSIESASAVEGLEHFSHVWIVFVFHLNTVGKSQPSKIAPPALGGQRVGVLSTRSPHRFNPIGMTLAKLDGIRTVRKRANGSKKPVRRTTHLELSGLDLVDGTPVLDIKPYVPTYDAPPGGVCDLPPWVSQGLATQRPVDLSEAAAAELRDILESNPSALEFYGQNGESIEETYADVTACIREVLSMDVRSQWQTQKARRGNFKAERAQRLQQPHDVESAAAVTPATMDDDDGGDACTQQIDNLLVRFTVSETTTDTLQREASAGSGAEDVVVVQSIQLIRHETTTT